MVLDLPGSLDKVMDVSSVNKRPDVLLLCVDDMNDWAGCLQGYPGVQTPHIDRLAASGTGCCDDKAVLL